MPVIVVTAVNDISVALDAIRKGAYDYLLKPFDRDDVLKTAERGLENLGVCKRAETVPFNLEQPIRMTERLGPAG